jgi:hypothetical protein
MSSIRNYIGKIPAGGSVTFGVTGTFIGLVKTDEDLPVLVKAVNDQGAEVVSVELKQGEKVPAARTFEQIQISNENSVDIAVAIVAGSGSFQSDRLSGEVSVSGAVGISPAKGITGRLFNMSNYTYGTGYQNFVLRNPTGSGKKIVIRELFYINKYTSATSIELTKLFGVNSTLSGEISSFLANPMVGSAGPSIARLAMTVTPTKFTLHHAANFDTAAYIIQQSGSAAHTEVNEKIELPQMMVLEEGEAVVISAGVANRQFKYQICYEEVTAL